MLHTYLSNRNHIALDTIAIFYRILLFVLLRLSIHIYYLLNSFLLLLLIFCVICFVFVWFCFSLLFSFIIFYCVHFIPFVVISKIQLLNLIAFISSDETTNEMARIANKKQKTKLICLQRNTILSSIYPLKRMI